MVLFNLLVESERAFGLACGQRKLYVGRMQILNDRGGRDVATWESEGIEKCGCGCDRVRDSDGKEADACELQAG